MSALRLVCQPTTERRTDGGCWLIPRLGTTRAAALRPSPLALWRSCVERIILCHLALACVRRVVAKAHRKATRRAARRLGCVALTRNEPAQSTPKRRTEVNPKIRLWIARVVLPAALAVGLGAGAPQAAMARGMYAYKADGGGDAAVLVVVGVVLTLIAIAVALGRWRSPNAKRPSARVRVTRGKVASTNPRWRPALRQRSHPD